jgi:folate/biopterin transporter
MGIEPTPTIVAIAVIYFVEGALGLARLAQSYMLKDELHLGPAELSALSGIFALPWTIKPLYGFLSDGFPLFGYQRKSYLVAAGILGAFSYWVLGQGGVWGALPPQYGVAGTVSALLLGSACIAFSDVVADGIVVQKTRQAAASGDTAMAGGLQSLCWGASAVGGLLSAYFSGSLLEVLSVRDIFSLAAVLPFLVSLIALGIDEKPVKALESSTAALVEGVKDQIDTLWQALKQPDIWKPALFLFLWQSTPTSDGAFFFFLTDDSGLGLGLGPEFLGRVRLVTSVAGLAGVWLYQQYFRTKSIKSILFWSTLASFPLGMLPVLLITHANRAMGIPDATLIFGDDVVLAALGQISFLPTLVLAARICPPGVEAVLFATLMSIFNGASTVGTEIGAALTKVFGVTESNFDNLYVLVCVSPS